MMLLHQFHPFLHCFLQQLCHCFHHQLSLFRQRLLFVLQLYLDLSKVFLVPVVVCLQLLMILVQLIEILCFLFETPTDLRTQPIIRILLLSDFFLELLNFRLCHSLKFVFFLQQILFLLLQPVIVALCLLESVFCPPFLFLGCLP